MCTARSIRRRTRSINTTRPPAERGPWLDYQASERELAWRSLLRFTAFALLSPLALLALGAMLGWVVEGYRRGAPPMSAQPPVVSPRSGATDEDLKMVGQITVNWATADHILGRVLVDYLSGVFRMET